jgi:hypothetical protein
MSRTALSTFAKYVPFMKVAMDSISWRKVLNKRNIQIGATICEEMKGRY